MAVQKCQLLNGILIRVHRSLLQFVRECWPWTQELAESPERAAIAGLVKSQDRDVVALVAELEQRGWPIDFGSYPVEFTDLHYVSLDYLLGEMIRDTESLIADVSRALTQFGGDATGVAVLKQTIEHEEARLLKLREIASERVVAR